LFIGAGRNVSLRPGDSWARSPTKSGVDSSAVGAIQILERHAIVEVPDEIADDIISALARRRSAAMRVQVRRDRDGR
jgi:ATP-dependent RNA helicase DeaD